MWFLWFGFFLALDMCGNEKGENGDPLRLCVCFRVFQVYRLSCVVISYICVFRVYVSGNLRGEHIGVYIK